jgi:uncharacterized ion transporter superfamily protein YfcC
MKIPNTFILLFGIVVLAGICTWIIGSGEFSRETIDVNGIERQVLVPGSFHSVKSSPQTWQIFSAFFDGFVRQSGIIAFIFIVGGVFYIIQESKSIELGISDFTTKIRQWDSLPVFRIVEVEYLIIILVMLVFSTFGAIYGMSEETIPFVLVFVPLAQKMGFDRFVGVSMCFVGAALGFAGALLNPFTIGVAQGISQIQPFSGIGYRLICFLAINVVGISYVLWYARKIRKKKEESEDLEGQADIEKITGQEGRRFNFGWDQRVLILTLILSLVLVGLGMKIGNTRFFLGEFSIQIPFFWASAIVFPFSVWLLARSSYQYFILILLGWVVAFLILGVMAYGWYIREIAALFFCYGVLTGLSWGISGDSFVEKFFKGVADIAPGALVVGFAGGIVEILENGHVIDTILLNIADLLNQTSTVVAANSMFLFQTFLNIFLPSGSGQAALTMPIMAPLSDLIGLSRQTAVLAYQFGDGFTNMITPTSGVLIGAIGLAKIPYVKWFKFILPLQIILFILGVILLSIAVLISPTGF